MSRADVIGPAVVVAATLVWFLVEMIRHPRNPGGDDNDGTADEV
ncbi:hypothetical protein ACFWUQ_23485 [Streptomyces sp. NPDC058662]